MPRNYSVAPMPGFHHFVAVLPLPFSRSIATVAVAGENGNAGNFFPYNIGMK